MKYVSIDTETSGLDEDRQLLSIGVIFEDTEKKLSFEEIPKFNAIVIQQKITGSPRALTMNENIIKLMGEYLDGNDDRKFFLSETTGYKFYYEDEVTKKLYSFLYNLYYPNTDPIKGFKNFNSGEIVVNGNTKPLLINVAGKNFGTFDLPTLKQLPWWKKLITVRQRIIDPSILFVDWKNDEMLPSLKECKERGGINGIVTHDAIEDAWDVIQVLRKHY